MEKDVIKKIKKEDLNNYTIKLKNWLLANQSIYFDTFKACHWLEFDYWYQENNSEKKISRRELVMKDEFLLIDREIDGVHMYVICQIIGKKKKICRDICPVIKVDDLDRSCWKNGYFLLPNISQTV